MTGFDLSEYVDVAERIRLFYEMYPEGRLLTVEHGQYQFGDQAFVYCKASAYKTPEDLKPCNGIAWEPVPGTTTFTRQSELQNAETAAWGRAIIAAGIPSKKIASAEEVRNRSSEPVGEGAQDPEASREAAGSEGRGKTKPQLLAYLADILAALKAAVPQQDWAETARAFSREHFDTAKSQELTKPQLESLVEHFEKKLAHIEAEAESIPFS